MLQESLRQASVQRPDAHSLRLCLVCDRADGDSPLPKGDMRLAMHFPLREVPERVPHVARRADEIDAVVAVWKAGHESDFVQLAEPLRLYGIPLVALVEDKPDDEIAALKAGADIAISRPIHPALLRTRLQAVARIRGNGHRAAGAFNAGGASNGEAKPNGEAALPDADHSAGTEALPEHQRRLGPMLLDRRAKTFRISEEALDLTPREFGIMEFLMDHAGACCTRDEILDAVWSIDYNPGSNMIDVYVHFLRNKLREHGIEQVIRTVRGEGYRLDESTSKTVLTK